MSEERRAFDKQAQSLPIDSQHKIQRLAGSSDKYAAQIALVYFESFEAERCVEHFFVRLILVVYADVHRAMTGIRRLEYPVIVLLHWVKR